MQIKKQTTTIPEQTIEKEIYICETCGKEHDTDYYICKCEVCGKEICWNCRNEQYLLETPSLNFFPRSNTLHLISSDDYGDVEMVEVHHLCKDCASNLDINSYKNNMALLVDQFNNSLKDLNEAYLKGELSQ